MNTLDTIGIISPGAMGSALGRCLAAGGARVISTTAGRSARTVALADGLQLVASVTEVVAQADLLISVAPPGHAVAIAIEIARAARERGVRPLVADLNAIAPVTVEQVRRALAEAGCELVDGSINGPPPGPSWPEPTVIYLSGPAADRVAGLPVPHVRMQVVGTELGRASAVKMRTASVYKGLAALFVQALRTAEWHGVTPIVLADLARDLPEHVAAAAQLIASAASKSDRHPGEMRQIALAQAAAGGEPALFEAMATVYESLRRSELAQLSPEQAVRIDDLSAALAALARRV
ncbi:MAG: DUF1932 domain-containing protein [Jatrophihabitans sp.]